MKAFLLCTRSHRELIVKHLLPSLPDDIDLVIRQGKQHCGTGEFMAEGWLECMREKVGMLVEAIDAHPGECLLHLDADIQFFVPRLEPILRRYLEHSDFVAQSDGKEDREDVFCGGLFAFRANAAVRGLFVRVLEIMEAEGINDQEALNTALRGSAVKAELLNPDHFWSPRSAWSPERPLALSPSAVMHHANWCSGVANKLSQLEEGRRLHSLWEGLERHGSPYGGKWIRADSLDEESVVYAAGVGEDISFDISLLDRYGVGVHAFDPTPRAIEYANEFAAIDPHFQFHPFGISGGEEGETTFHRPRNPEHVSCSLFETGGGEITFPVKPLERIMAELGHTRIDLLKMDIEGAEYEVLERLLAGSPPILPGQLLVEFHDGLAPGLGERKARIVRDLLARGYELSYQEGCEYSFCLTGVGGGGE